MTRSLTPVGQWLGESFAALRPRGITLALLFVFGLFVLLLGVALVYVLGFAIYGTLQGWDNMVRLLLDPQRLQYLMEESWQAIALLNILAVFVGMRIYCWVTLAAIHASMDESLGVRGALSKGKGRGYPFIALFLLQQVIVYAGMLLLILPGIALTVWLGFSFCAFAKEESGVFQSLRDSARAVKGNFFGVLGRMILAGILGGLMMIVPVIGWLAGSAWMLIAWSLLYDDLRGSSPAPAKPSPVPRPRIVYPAASQYRPAH